MIKESLFPVQWENWDLIDNLFNYYYNAEFLEDFGVFKKGEKYRSISVHYAEGVITAFNDEAEPVKTQKYIATPITE